MIHGEDINIFWENIKQKKGCLMSIDYGTKKTGISISNHAKNVCVPTAIIETSELLSYLDQEIEESEIVGIVLGLPKKLNGQEYHPLAMKVMYLAKIIDEHKNIDIVFHDERMSSVGAFKNLKYSVGQSKIKSDFNEDAHAAQFILQGIMDKLNNF